MIKGLLARIPGWERHQVRREIERYERGLVACEKCRRTASLADFPALSLQKCPACGDLLVVPMKVADWWVTRPLGAGGAGCVYLARQADEPSAKAAVKVLRRSAQGAEAEVAALMREAEIGHGFGSHPHLARIHDYGQWEDNTFVIMEYVEGTRLDDIMDRHVTRMGPEEAMYYAFDVLSALEHMYAHGYVYRDLKPQNVIIKPDGFAALIDYGLCMTIEESRRQTQGPILGSPLYMAPERSLALGEDARSDMYSLGMVLFHMLTGDSYFSSTAVGEVVEGHTRRVRMPIGSKMPGFDPDLAGLVDRLIRRTRRERFSSYAELREAMEAVRNKLAKGLSRSAFIRKRRRHWRA